MSSRTAVFSKQWKDNAGCLSQRSVICIYWYIYRGYYMAVQRYDFIFKWWKQYFTNKRSEWVKYCF
jgi:hypothetical protein